MENDKEELIDASESVETNESGAPPSLSNTIVDHNLGIQFAGNAYHGPFSFNKTNSLHFFLLLFVSILLLYLIFSNRYERKFISMRR